MKANVKTQTGNRISVVFDGKVIGLVQSVNMNDSYGLEAASGIGDIHVQEHVPTMATHSLSVSTLLLKKGAMMQAGIVPENGEFALQGLVFDFEVYSKDDNTLLRKYIGVSYDSGGMDVSKHAIIVQNGQFKALDVTGTAA
ncbi:hypothetical protein [Pseudomonas sp.]|jgi:hypothetical protein|uniref:hypothetical protein n=1 Tax=Pseudomonas sp. TaxID=306 RepID=UPI003FD6CCB4